MGHHLVVNGGEFYGLLIVWLVVWNMFHHFSMCLYLYIYIYTYMFYGIIITLD